MRRKFEVPSYHPDISDPVQKLATSANIDLIGTIKRPWRGYELKDSTTRNFDELTEFLDQYPYSVDRSVFEDYRFDNPTSDALREHIKKFTDGDVNLDRNAPNLLRLASAALDNFENRGVFLNNWFNPSHVLKVSFPHSSSPGAFYSDRFKSKTKLAAYKFASEDALKLMRQLEEGRIGEAVDRPARMAARGRRYDLNGKRKPIEGRLILNVDFMHYLVGSVTSKAYEKMLNSLRPQHGGVMIGLGPYGGKWNYEYSKIQNYRYVIEFDFSSFDQSLAKTVINAAFSHIERHFDSGRSSRTGQHCRTRYFDYLRRNMINTVIMDPSGTCFRKRAGIASGDPYTSIVGSYANLLMTIAAHAALGYVLNKDYVPWAYGDDGLVCYRRVPPQVDEYALMLKSLFGTIVKPSQTKLNVWGVKDVLRLNSRNVNLSKIMRTDTREGLYATDDLDSNDNLWRSVYKLASDYAESDRWIYPGFNSVLGLDGDFLHENVTFLGNQFTCGGHPVRSLTDCLVRLGTPERHPWPRPEAPRPHDYNLWVASRIAAFYVVFYWNPVASRLLADFHTWFVDNHPITVQPNERIVTEIRRILGPNIDPTFIQSHKLPSHSDISFLYSRRYMIEH